MSYAIYPAVNFIAVVPSDTAKLTFKGDVVRARGIYAGGAGKITIKDPEGNLVTFFNVIPGSVLPISTDQVMATDTDAGNIVALL